MAKPKVLLEAHLKALRLPTFLREYDKVARQCAAEGLDCPRYLLRLSELELLDREQRATERRIKAAKFPVLKSLETFEFRAIPSLNKSLVLELARADDLDRRENALALGNSGTGKTHIALALGLAACQKGYRVRFTTAAALVNELLEARDEKRLLRFQKQLAKQDLLIVDELGYVPLSKTGSELLFEVFSQRYERASTLVTSNLPFNEWTEIFGSERLTGALLDRLTHHVHILEMNGESYRLTAPSPEMVSFSTAAVGSFCSALDSLLVWKVSRLGRDMREVISTESASQREDCRATQSDLRPQGSGQAAQGRPELVSDCFQGWRQHRERASCILGSDNRTRLLNHRVGFRHKRPRRRMREEFNYQNLSALCSDGYLPKQPSAVAKILSVDTWRREAMLILLGAVLAIGIFILDLLLPLGVAASIAYVGLVLISLWLSGSPSTYVAAVVGTILNLLGLTLSVPGGIEWMVLTNRSLALILIWAAAVIVLQRKQTQEELVRAGRRLGERVIRAAPNLIYIYNLRTARLIYANPEVLRRLHSSADSLDTLDFANLRVHPDDVDHVKAQFARCDALSDDETLHVTCRILHPSGELLWYSARHVVFSRDPDGSAREILGVAEDTTDRESARDALGRSAAELRLLALRLISIQEEERKRVAREIHDNISQHMAAAAIQTSKLARDLPANPDKLRHTLQSLGREIGAVSDELHRLSHQLHPSVLENLGLEATLEAECSTFAKREGIPVSFQAGRIPEQIPPDVALCLYRVAQESFRNIARHARAAKVEVTLCLAEDAILLRVKDSGKGFRIEDAKRRGGVGLTSMQERTRLIGASLELISEPGAGAEVRVLAPLLEVER